jgi:hypothetical protein
MEHPVTERLDKYFRRAVCRNCHRKLEIQRDIKGLTHNGKRDVGDSGPEKHKRYLLINAEDLDSIAELLESAPDFPIQLIIADYKARAASLRRFANVVPLTPDQSSPTIPKKKPSAVPQSGSRADARSPSPETRLKAKRS